MATKTKTATYVMTIIRGSDRRAIHAPDCEHADAIAQAVADGVVDVQQIDADALRSLDGVAGAPYVDTAGCLLSTEE